MHLVSFLRGMAFGGLLVYLFAPRSGAETREMLAQKGSEIKDLITEDLIGVTEGATGHSMHHVIDEIDETEMSGGNIYDPATLKEL